MKIIRGLHNLHDTRHACALAIGNFDGVHLGHQAILQALVKKARELNVPAMVMSFEPLPREFFSQDSQRVPARLTRFREKALLLKEQGVDVLFVSYFNQAFSQLSKEQFVKDILIKKLGVKYLTVGEDFRFAYRREGNFEYLKNIAEHTGIVLEGHREIMVDEQRISSTWIRKCLATDDLNKAAQLLGRPYSMIGRVVHGQKLGRELGFPTANFHLHRHKTPVHGVYAVKVYGVGDQVLYGAANVGERPAVNGTRTLLEVYLFDFSQDIYAYELEVEFVHKLRAEEYYDSLDALKAKIAEDVQQIRAFFGLRS